MEAHPFKTPADCEWTTSSDGGWLAVAADAESHAHSDNEDAVARVEFGYVVAHSRHRLRRLDPPQHECARPLQSFGVSGSHLAACLALQRPHMVHRLVCFFYVVAVAFSATTAIAQTGESEASAISGSLDAVNVAGLSMPEPNAAGQSTPPPVEHTGLDTLVKDIVSDFRALP